MVTFDVVPREKNGSGVVGSRLVCLQDQQRGRLTVGRGVLAKVAPPVCCSRLRVTKTATLQRRSMHGTSASSARMTDLQHALMEALQIHRRLHRALHHHQLLHCLGAGLLRGSEGADGGGERDEGAGGSAASASARAADLSSLR